MVLPLRSQYWLWSFIRQAMSYAHIRAHTHTHIHTHTHTHTPPPISTPTFRPIQSWARALRTACANSLASESPSPPFLFQRGSSQNPFRHESLGEQTTCAFPFPAWLSGPAYEFFTFALPARAVGSGCGDHQACRGGRASRRLGRGAPAVRSRGGAPVTSGGR